MLNLNRRHMMVLTGAALATPSLAAPIGFTKTKGGDGGRTIRVTNLNPAGEGSFKAAIEAEGARKVVFDVAGIIDLERTSIDVKNPYLTIAGETAPDPGITLIKGSMKVATHDVIIRHIAIRAGTAGMAKKSGFEPDGLSTVAGHDVIIDHCSFCWAVDEALSASGPRFEGADLAAWRAHTSHNITFSNNLIAESLRNASHSKGPHSMGSLVHDNVTNVMITGNLYAHNNERHPLVKGGAQCAVINNVFVNPGHTCSQYTLVADQWVGRTPEPGAMLLVGNVMRGGVDTRAGLAMLTFGGAGDLRLHADDNIATYKDGTPAPIIGYYQSKPDGLPEDGPYIPVAFIRSMPRETLWPSKFKAIKSDLVEASVYKMCGSRPWSRSAIDARIVEQARAGTGRIIDSQDDVGGYPT
jgi:pectate lyase